jgi:hypothetical protein
MPPAQMWFSTAMNIITSASRRKRPVDLHTPRRGLRQFVVGTGGKSLRDFEHQAGNSLLRNSNAFGVLKLTLLRVAVHPCSGRDVPRLRPSSLPLSSG